MASASTSERPVGVQTLVGLLSPELAREVIASPLSLSFLKNPASSAEARSVALQLKAALDTTVSSCAVIMVLVVNQGIRCGRGSV